MENTQKRKRGRPRKDGQPPRTWTEEERKEYKDRNAKGNSFLRSLPSPPDGITTHQQQKHLRQSLMPAAMECVRQVTQYIAEDQVTHPKFQEVQIKVTPMRQRTWEMVLRKVVSDLKSSTVEHTTDVQRMPTEVLVEKLGDAVKDKPELKAKLFEILGGKVIDSDS